MGTRVGINGFGRIGRLALRAAWGRDDLTFAHINELKGDAATSAHLLTFDSVHGRWDRDVCGDGAALTHVKCTLDSGASQLSSWIANIGADASYRRGQSVDRHHTGCALTRLVRTEHLWVPGLPYAV